MWGRGVRRPPLGRPRGSASRAGKRGTLVARRKPRLGPTSELVVKPLFNALPGRGRGTPRPYDEAGGMVSPARSGDGSGHCTEGYQRTCRQLAQCGRGKVCADGQRGGSALEGPRRLDRAENLHLRRALGPCLLHDPGDLGVRSEEALEGLRALPLVEDHQVPVALEEPMVPGPKPLRVLRDLIEQGRVRGKCLQSSRSRHT